MLFLTLLVTHTRTPINGNHERKSIKHYICLADKSKSPYAYAHHPKPKAFQPHRFNFEWSAICVHLFVSHPYIVLHTSAEHLMYFSNKTLISIHQLINMSYVLYTQYSTISISTNSVALCLGLELPCIRHQVDANIK